MQRHPHRAFAHREFRRGRLDRRAVHRDRLQHVALARRQAFEMSGCTSRAGTVSSGASPGITSAKSSMLTNTRRPRRRSASISLLRAIANSQGANGALASQVCRFRCTANKISCTMSSAWSTGCPAARASPRRAMACGSTGADGAEQALIRSIIPCNGRPHQAGPLVLTIAQRALPLMQFSLVDLSICVTPQPFR